MKCLVTGGAGFIGSNLVDELIDKGYETTVIDNESASENEKFFWNSKAVNFKYDICNYNQIKNIFKNVDCVFHLAAQSRIQPSIINPEETFKINCEGTLNVLRASKESKVKKFVYSSTSSYYGLNKVPFQENMKRDCLNPYSYTKSFGEDLSKMFYQLYGLNIFILRYFNVYGERQPTRGQYAPVVGIFQKQYKNKEKMTVVGDGQQRRDYTHVSDVVRANMMICDSSLIGCELFNVGTGKSYSVLEIAKMIGGEYEFIPPRPGEAKETLADISKIEKMLGWHPVINIQDWIKEHR